MAELLKAEETVGETSRLLSSFTCETNQDVQNFLRDKAISFEQNDECRTTLVMRGNNIAGYFSILIKTFYFTDASKNTRKRLGGSKEAESFNTILIAQLARSDKCREQVEGFEILDIAMQKCSRVKELVSLKVVCVEHKEIRALESFYTKNGFNHLQNNENDRTMKYIRI